MVQHFFAILKWQKSCLILLLASEMAKKIREADFHKQEQQWPICKKKFGNNDKFEFSNFFSPVPTSQNDYQCFGNMDYCRLQFDCQSFIILLVVRYRSIQSKTTDFWLAFVDTSKTLSLAQVK